MSNEIIRTEHKSGIFIKRYGWCEGGFESGTLLTMADGSQWLHPYSGRTPFCFRQPDAAPDAAKEN